MQYNKHNLPRKLNTRRKDTLRHNAQVKRNYCRLLDTIPWMDFCHLLTNIMPYFKQLPIFWSNDSKKAAFLKMSHLEIPTKQPPKLFLSELFCSLLIYPWSWAPGTWWAPSLIALNCHSFINFNRSLTTICISWGPRSYFLYLFEPNPCLEII